MRIKCKEGKEEGMKEARIQEGKERKEGGNIEGHIERKRKTAGDSEHLLRVMREEDGEGLGRRRG